MADTPTPLQVFVSHSTEDRDACDTIVRALRGAGADVWYDSLNLGTARLMEEVQTGFEKRPVFLVLLSKSAFASEWVRRESRWAYSLNRREPNRVILPITVGPIDLRDFNTLLFLKDFKRIEAADMRPLPENDRISQMLRVLGLTLAEETPAELFAEALSDLLTHGRALQAQQKYVEALPLFQRATQLDPNDFLAWFGLGYTLTELKDYAEALSAYDQSLALDPSNALAWNNKGTALRSLGRDEEGLVAFDHALALRPESAVAWNNKGSALISLGRYEEGLLATEQALMFNPRYAAAWNNKGTALASLQRWDSALAACDTALALAPTNATWRLKANILRQLGREAEAVEATLRAKTSSIPTESAAERQPWWGIWSEEQSESDSVHEISSPDERPRVTVFHPNLVPIFQGALFIAYVHVVAAMAAVRQNARQFFSETVADTLAEESASPLHDLKRGSRLRLRPRLPGARFDPEEAMIHWTDDWHRTIFTCLPGPVLDGLQSHGALDVWVMSESGDLLIAVIPIAAQFSASDDPPREREPPPGSTSTPNTNEMHEEGGYFFTRIFVSYAHEDSSVVDQCCATYTALGIDILRDKQSLHAGQEFSSALMRLIDSCDIFQLYWSKRAAVSDWVQREWHHALDCARAEGFIRPLFWEQPMEPSPPELANLHFAQLTLPQQATE